MATRQTDRIDARAVRQLVDRPDPVTVIDVRSPAEFETAHLRGSVNLPLDLIADNAALVADRLHRQVVLVCKSGVRAEQARQHLAGAGAGNLRILDGGVTAYMTAGGDSEESVVRGRTRWSLERQVRLVAGTVVLAGLVGGLRVPKARLLAGGIGAGLTLSALIDTCTMGRVLARLPYNRGPRERTLAEILDQIPTHLPRPEAE